MREIQITTNESGQRFDKFLAKYLNQAPKSFLYKMLRKKNIILNGKKASGVEKLQTGDVVKIFFAEETIDKFSSFKIQKTSVTLDIIYEDEDVLFINKPAGMLSQKAEVKDESVVEHVISYLLRSKQLTEEQLQTFRPSICNRLDRNTSGLITAGKSMVGLQKLSQSFKERTMGKYYIAIVNGEVKKAEYLKGYLSKNEETNKVKVTAQPHQDGDFIETEYKPIWSTPKHSLIEVHLITGKTHQIRAHLSFINHGIIGDGKYGDATVNKKYRETYGVKHQLLHAYRLEFDRDDSMLETLAGKTFIAPLPKIFKTISIDARGDYEHLEFKRS